MSEGWRKERIHLLLLLAWQCHPSVTQCPRARQSGRSGRSKSRGPLIMNLSPPGSIGTDLLCTGPCAGGPPCDPA